MIPASCLILFLVLLILLGGILLQLLFEKVLFWPDPVLRWDPASKISEKHEDVQFSSDSGNTLHGWYFSKFPRAKTVLFNHGNAGNISYRSTVLRICLQQKLNILIYDYSGFGLSTGKPSQSIVMQDGLAAYDYLISRGLQADDIIIWGESMGGAIATYIASERKCHLLILMATFASLSSCISTNPTVSKVCGRHGGYLLAKSIFDIFGYDSMNSQHRLSTIKCPVAIVHSKEDNLINYCNAEALYEAIEHSDKILIPVKGNHATPQISDSDLEKLFTFCRLDRQYLFSEVNRPRTRKILRVVAGESSEGDSSLEFERESESRKILLEGLSEKTLSQSLYHLS